MRPAPLALYIHWPFCASKCPYCDFNSHVRESVDVGAWRAALLADMAYEAAQTGPRVLGSIFFGGGTPSLMPPALVADLIAAAGRHWTFADDIEITLEANPNSVEVARFADLAAAGVNRVSLGIQSFEADALRFLGRAHDASEAHTALDVAQSTFARVSFDLIYALPGQSLTQWQAQLKAALARQTSHLSLYQLTIEPGTRFETLVRQGDFTPLDADHAADLYEATQELAAQAGIPAYEVSNHARAGEESRHNLAYWRYQDYVGIGPGAHGRRPFRLDASPAHSPFQPPIGYHIGGLGGGAGWNRSPTRTSATQRHKKPENWLAAVARNGHGAQAETPLAPEDQAREALMMGLRLAEGIDIAALSARLGLDANAMIDNAAVARLTGHGLLHADGPRLAVTPAGMLLLDAILPQIVV
ncbi:radical SAM family heme chaperone HemW [Sphingobium sp. DEHP117]|uniref:radical SAM family heme chaperone HemW n=1 Tax=Sphingobium sp. DEHP117 TaxID=2993436 RepID=UPI0027D7244B|nr:radical SAM family heme chaperone HemW [Sphingobium sp. DEHP117]MDQ4418869.1 radical SAM family heme chaperone HemW [Sphingobium sp. DEHP117]